jgi:hypothetical protein
LGLNWLCFYFHSPLGVNSQFFVFTVLTFILAIQKIGFGIFGPKMGVHFYISSFHKSLESACGGQDWVCFAKKFSIPDARFWIPDASAFAHNAIKNGLFVKLTK